MTAALTKNVARVNAERLLATMAEMSRFGAQPNGGITRPGFSEPERKARDHLARRATEQGFLSTVDAAGNLIIRRPGADPTKPTLMLGSHLDSVTNGGQFDGTYGVVAALEVLRQLTAEGRTGWLEPVVVAFSNEEGAKFPYPFFGSRAVVGQSALPSNVTHGAREELAIELRLSGGDIDRQESARWPTPIGAYLEVHIEQGPTLERAGVPIGVVDTINGRTIVEIEIRGRQAHAGTTPMNQRADALATAARVILVIERAAREQRLCSVSTVGNASVTPGEANVVAGEVHLTAEIRDSNRGRLRRAEAAIRAELDTFRVSEATLVHIDVTMRTDPVAADATVSSVIREAASSLELEHLVLSSGAGHDAQIIAAEAPIGMIFVPSRGGVSHAPEEYTDDEDLVHGANVLLQSAILLMEQEGLQG
ncbi:Zn-dependent hydrolase [Micromonospora parathelypteridis]|uniref:N-carbamoyl-L-amino-acid hydrolase n=1 Tax=Micromonospora parathelypteridis TaxID=1839617 RepID=A0A840W6W9_9ACTN|nr:Zn-dependent hydrolase [Micromonospora parathelypteridis]MBB5480808.1 N-carbamoyl-L-amino-acid hydrolase [Micromonospora parathelypteridis]GGO21515.1 Zn-dependent hydrolase [Micromonospora parathelypteridis]